MFISNAYAAAPAASGIMGSLTQFVPILLMFVALYFLMIRPQMKRQKEHKLMVEAVTRGDEVVTSGGVLGKVTKVSDVYVSIEVQEGTELVLQKSAITTLLPKGTIKSL
ncbi:putative Preprotein translocase subunit YajC [Herminiimonas arsenicoxydans]|uniref:Sec translocon accessory complex subunit YajC n=2 Tax=Herminiimonas TaxID=303379 RepID=A4G1Z4_HERAR|nr:putative Preprotein translocase subunit YajC [Herminiimonas arsenicoxydans]